VREFYESSADWYSNMMDTEIDLPVYSDTLGRLAERIADKTGDSPDGIAARLLDKLRQLPPPVLIVALWWQSIRS